MRRLHRGGEGQYRINRAAVRRADLVELLADVGLGGTHGSVISQGKVEEILASKPEERRGVSEGAARAGEGKRGGRPPGGEAGRGAPPGGGGRAPPRRGEGRGRAPPRPGAPP